MRNRDGRSENAYGKSVVGWKMRERRSAKRDMNDGGGKNRTDTGTGTGTVTVTDLESMTEAWIGLPVSATPRRRLLPRRKRGLRPLLMKNHWKRPPYRCS